MKPTDISAPDYFHKVVDCQWACPAHTPVPEYIRLIAEGRYSDAYMINWKSNVFPGILGRTCDRPCEPACRRGRVEDNPVAICRLKRVAADFKDDIKHRLPKPGPKNGKRIALVGGGPASLAVARDLAPLGYHCTVFDGDPKAGGMMRSQIPKFRLPDSVIDEETDYVLNLGVEFKGGQRVDSLKQLLSENYDAIFVGSGAPRGRELDIPGRQDAGAISASSGSPTSRSAMSKRSAAASSCSAAATPRWIAAAPRAGSAARPSRWSSAPASRR
jgi:formate dehydrogenase beta subunit